MKESLKIDVNKKNISVILFTIFMFCAVFTPDFFPFSMRYLLVIVSVIGIAWNVVSTGHLEFDKTYLSIIKGFAPFLIFFVISQLFRCVFDSGNTNAYIGTLSHTLIALGGAFVLSLFMIQVCRTNRISFDSVTCIVLVVTAVQLVCVCLALLVPGIRNYFNSLIIKNSHSDRLAELAQASISGSVDRSYGLSNNLFDSFGYITAMLIALVFALGMDKKNIKLVFLSFIFVLMPLVNSRTGIVLALIGFFVVFLYYCNVDSIIKIAGIIILALLGMILLLNRLPDSMLYWLETGVKETMTLFNDSGTTGTYSELFEVDIVLPSNILFGAGGSPSTFDVPGIDNGYINCIWYFGVVGTVLLFAGYINLFGIAYNYSKSKICKVIALVFCLIFFVYLIKNYSIDNFGGNAIIFGIPALAATLPRNKEFMVNEDKNDR